MDLNELLHKHQLEVMEAATSGDGPGREHHFAKVAEYAERVRALREMHPMTDDPTGADAPPAIIYGTYAGDAGKPSAAAPIASWEDEGGAIDDPRAHAPMAAQADAGSERQVPEGIETVVRREYRVGPYTYQDLDLAVAEHLRQLAAGDHGPA